MRTARLSSAVLPLLLAIAGPALYGAPYAVSGVVVDSQSHAPLASVRVSLVPAVTQDRRIEQVTKKDGLFSFTLSQPGKYSLQVVKSGYPAQAYRQASFAGVSSAILVRDDQDTRHIIFEAWRGSAISGQIKDEDSEPVGNALVTVFQSLITGGERKVVARRQTRANAAGEFRVASLPPGDYYICAMGRPWFADSILQLQDVQASMRLARQPDSPIPGEPADAQPAEPPAPVFSPDPNLSGTAFLTTFYPHSQTVEDASTVHTDAGSEVQASITLPFSRAVTLKGTLTVPGSTIDGRVILYKKVYDQYVSFLEEWVQKDGTFTFKNVPAGSYEIVGASQSSAAENSWYARQDIEVGTLDMNIALSPPQMGSLAGTVIFEGPRPASLANLFISLRSDKGALHRSEIGANGNFSLSRLPPGRYELTAGSREYIAAYVATPGGEHLPLTIDIPPGETVNLNVALTRAVSAIDGSVESGGAPQVGAFVLLMPRDPAQRWAYRVDQTDSDGTFRLAAIPSGDYFLIALDSAENVAYRDAAVAAILASAAKTVHIEQGAHQDLKLEIVLTGRFKLPSR